MQLTYIFLASLIIASNAAAQSQTLIQDVTVISPESASPLVHAHVLLEGDRILSVGQTKPNIGPQTKVIDGQGKFLTPGLIDAHVHLMAFPGMNRGQQKKMGKVAEQYQTQMPRSYLFYGYTTLIDLAVIDRAGLDAIKRSSLAPDIYDCDQPVPLANGYPMSYAEPEERFELFKNFLYDSRQKAKHG